MCLMLDHFYIVIVWLWQLYETRILPVVQFFMNGGFFTVVLGIF